jgi:hypothetical protein
MTRNRLALAIVLVLASASASAASAQSWTYIVGPTAPAAGDTMSVHVLSAPTFPVVVEIYIDGRLVHTQTIHEPPGSVQYTIPAAASGKVWEVRLLGSGGAVGSTRSGIVQ